MNQTHVTMYDDQITAAAMRVIERCRTLAAMSECSGHLTRTFCCPAMHDVHREIAKWMQAANMQSHVDAVGNLVGSQSHDCDDAVFLIGSHLDTVVNAGKFDGALGVLLGIAAAEILYESRTPLSFSLHVIGFSEEEGVRFKTPYIGSAAVAGRFDASTLNIADADGVTVGDALKAFGLNPNDYQTASYTDRNLVGFLEAHIEQGPVLESAGCPVGVVSAIAGQTRATITFQGKSGHAGTVPPIHRRDALAGAAQYISAVEQLGSETPDLFATVAAINVQPNVSNVIPSRAVLQLDLRHATDSVRKNAFTVLQNSAQQIANDRGLKCSIQKNLSQNAVLMHQQITRVLTQSLRQAKLSPQILHSGAGHDAAMMAHIAPTGMLFIRCREGISHHPDEHVDTQDVTTALKIMFNTLIQISKENNQS